MKDHREYLYGIVVGALLVFVPWWVSLLAIAAIITYLVMSNKDDKPTQAQTHKKVREEKEASSRCSRSGCSSPLEEGECTWDFL